MKNIITITSLLVAGAALANAATTYIDFANVTDTSTTSADVLKVTASLGTDISTELKALDGTLVATLTSLTMSNIGSVGDAKVLATLSDTAQNYFDEDMGFVWKDSISNYNDNATPLTATFTLSANTDYTVALLGGRNGALASYSDAFSNLSLTLGSTALAGIMYDGTSDTTGTAFASSYTGTGDLSSNQQLIVWTFSTGAIAETLTLHSDNGTYNALSISAVPEPSAFGLLAGLGALALAGTRRRRKA
ncbi:MAG: PEP-CTERM sorting domain-containing protein [Candidatus Spyradosoma sp.]